ncbi:MAG: glycosyltransferase family 2 protein [Patescibacteria group bacterium]
MELSIAINNYRNPELLKLCINSIKKNVLGIEYELIVADAETEEGTEMMMREDYPDVRFFPFRKNVGFQAMLKKGIEKSKGDYILLLNGDIIVNPGSAEKLLEYVKKNPEVGIAGPKLLNFNGTLQYSCFHYYKPLTIIYRRILFIQKFGFVKKHLDWFSMKDYDHENIKEVDWLMGSAMLVSRKAAEKVGMMDPQFFMYMEDVDWCRRFWENGFKVVYYPLSVMNHYHGKGSDKGGLFRSVSNKLTWIHVRSAIKYFWKYRGKEIPKHK